MNISKIKNRCGGKYMKKSLIHHLRYHFCNRLLSKKEIPIKGNA